MKRARFHVLGLAHQPVTRRVPSCAYTAKVFNMCRMLKRAGHEVLLYHAGSSVQRDLADEFIQVVSDETLASLYGDSYYETYNDTWKEDDAAWMEFRRNAGIRMSKRLSDQGDFVLASFGTSHEAACPPPATALTIEMGIGYEGVFAKCKVWESYAWRHYVYGKRPWVEKERDTVIPGYLEPNDFVYNGKKEGYLLCLGRVIHEKGVETAASAAHHLGVPLKVVGKGDPRYIQALTSTYPEVEYIEMVGIAQRAQLLAKASCLLAPTRFVEPFGNVAIEAMVSGTPVVASDWGAFTETVIPGETGFRCSDVPGMVSAIQRVLKGEISSEKCRAFALNFSLEETWKRYEAYFSYQHRVFSLEHGFKVDEDLPVQP